MTASHIAIICLFFLMGGFGMAAIQGALSTIFRGYVRTVSNKRHYVNTGSALKLTSSLQPAMKKLSS